MGKVSEASLTRNENSISVIFSPLPALDDATRWHIKLTVFAWAKSITVTILSQQHFQRR